MIESKTNVAIPPGFTIKEQLLLRGFTQKEFAERMELSEKHISKLLNGEVLLTHDVANRLEMVLGIPAYIWSQLESLYRNDIIQVNLENNINTLFKSVKKFPYDEIAELGFVPVTKNKLERLINLKKYFEVNNLDLIINNSLNISNKLTNSNKPNLTLLAWAQQARLLARDIETKTINIKKLSKNINLIKGLITQNIDTNLGNLKNILNECGVALIILPNINNEIIHGATFIDNKKIVLAIVSNDNNDDFCFSFFYELGHIILEHIYKDYSIEFEKEANDFALDILKSTN